MDVTDLVDYNRTLLNPNDLTNSFFCLSKKDPSVGFPFDASNIAGETYPGHADCPPGKLSYISLNEHCLLEPLLAKPWQPASFKNREWISLIHVDAS